MIEYLLILIYLILLVFGALLAHGLWLLPKAELDEVPSIDKVPWYVFFVILAILAGILYFVEFYAGVIALLISLVGIGLIQILSFLTKKPKN